MSRLKQIMAAVGNFLAPEHKSLFRSKWGTYYGRPWPQRFNGKQQWKKRGKRPS